MVHCAPGPSDALQLLVRMEKLLLAVIAPSAIADAPALVITTDCGAEVPPLGSVPNDKAPGAMLIEGACSR
jgi:hypothetical protein